jgi:hypothetical protein
VFYTLIDFCNLIVDEKKTLFDDDDDDDDDDETNEGPRKKNKIVDSIKLKVAAKMEDVTVKIENDIREIAALEVNLNLRSCVYSNLIRKLSIIFIITYIGEESSIGYHYEKFIYGSYDESRRLYSDRLESENDTHKYPVNNWWGRINSSPDFIQFRGNIRL